VNHTTISNMPDKQGVRYLFLFLAIPLLTACPVSSTAVSDANLVVDFLVQNDNGQTNAIVKLETRDPAGRHDVDLVSGESVSYRHDGKTDELLKRDDGEYIASLPADSTGFYRFILVRQSDSREQFDREVDNNLVYLPDTFQELQAEPAQTGASLNVSWLEENNPLSIDGVTISEAVDTFNAIAGCQNANGPFSIAITSGQITQQNSLIFLDIAVAKHLTDVLDFSIDEIANTTCEFDVQLLREIVGITDIALDRRSSATGQVLKNLSITWNAQ